ncbi:MAG: ABC transporter substrate-binding protein, partial [Alphaproteobacteria bacterium]|nr:ABC transporter substrate-binding protein [Alphaproteobacteria bacterium]
MKFNKTLTLLAGAAIAVSAAAVASPAMAQKEISIIRTIDTDRYDPHRSTARSAAEILFMVGDTLVALDYDLKTVKPGLAKSWTVSEDGLLYTFNLKEGVKFCSGKEFTANDVVATINRWRDPATKGVVTWRAGPVKEVRAKDKLTVEYELTKPYAELLFQMTQHFHTIINVDQAKQLGDDFGVKALDTTGPFCFDSWAPRNQTVLTKHKGYNWGPDFYKNKEAQVDKITWKIVPEESTRVASLQTNQADASQYVPYWSLDQFKANSKMSVTQAEAYYWTYFMGMKITREFMQDLKVRQAMNLAIDAAAITEAVTFGYATPATSYIDRNVLDFNEAVSKEPFRYDPEAAGKLLDEAGWKMTGDGFRYKDGKKLAPLVYGFTDTWRQIVEAVQGDLRKVGVDLQIQLFDATVVWGKLATQEFD